MNKQIKNKLLLSLLFPVCFWGANSFGITSPLENCTKLNATNNNQTHNINDLNICDKDIEHTNCQQQAKVVTEGYFNFNANINTNDNISDNFNDNSGISIINIEKDLSQNFSYTQTHHIEWLTLLNVLNIISLGALLYYVHINQKTLKSYLKIHIKNMLFSIHLIVLNNSVHVLLKIIKLFSRQYALKNKSISQFHLLKNSHP